MNTTRRMAAHSRSSEGMRRLVRWCRQRVRTPSLVQYGIIGTHAEMLSGQVEERPGLITNFVHKKNRSHDSPSGSARTARWFGTSW
jgi:hypothetical protein